MNQPEKMQLQEGQSGSQPDYTRASLAKGLAAILTGQQLLSRQGSMMLARSAL